VSGNFTPVLYNQRLSCDDWLEVKREDYQKYSVLYCVTKWLSIIMNTSCKWSKSCWFSFRFL